MSASQVFAFQLSLKTFLFIYEILDDTIIVGPAYQTLLLRFAAASSAV